MRHVSLLTFILALFLLAPVYESQGYKNPSSPKVSIVQENNNMYKNVMAIRGNYHYVTPTYVNRLIKEAREVSAMPGNGWMSPQDLMGLVMGESDLRSWVITGRNGMWDCGIGQNHTPLFRKTYKGRWKLCQQLTKSTKLSFIHTMKELNTIRNKWCGKRYKALKKKNHAKWKHKQYRCNFNIYNQGPRFLYRKSCWVRYKNKNYSPGKYRKKVNKCLYINRYWLRTYCFIRGMEVGRKPVKSCRYAYSIRWINKVYGVKQ